jgi:MFS family permease
MPPGAVAGAGLLALALAMGIGRFAFTPLLPMMQEDAGVTLPQGGYLAAANYVGYLIGALLAARPAAAHVAIRGALIAISLATLAMGLVHGLVLWTLLRALAGIGSAFALVHVSSWCLQQLAPARKPLLGASVFSGVGFGIVLAGGLCLALMRLHASSAQAWIALGVLSAAITALVWPVFARAGVYETQTRARQHWTADSLRLVLCYGAFGFAYIIPATYVPLMAKQVIADPAVFGWAWPVFGAAALASTLIAGSLLRAAGERGLWAIAALAMAAGVAAPAVAPGLAGILAAALLVGGTFMVITMAAMQEARRVAGAHAAPLMAAMTASFAAGQIAGPLVVSYFVHTQAGLETALAFAAALVALSAIALVRKEKS